MHSEVFDLIAVEPAIEGPPLVRRDGDKHTPGPWIVTGSGNVYAAKFYKRHPFTDLDGVEHPDYHKGLVALVYSGDDGCKYAENARLIAAAPLMLDNHIRIVNEAKELVAKHCKCGPVDAACSYCEILYLATEAVRQAKGDD